MEKIENFTPNEQAEIYAAAIGDACEALVTFNATTSIEVIHDRHLINVLYILQNLKEFILADYAELITGEISFTDINIARMN